MTCKSCKEEREIYAKGMCHRCLMKEWRKNNPKKEKEIRNRYYEKHNNEIKKRNKEWKKENPKKVKEMHKRYYEKHKNEIKEYVNKWRNKNKEKIKQKEVCKILKEHAKKLRDDPERLSTEYIRKMSNINFECKDDKDIKD